MPRKKAAPKAAGLTFLVSTDVEKPDADTRKFIRSHVMLGKNYGKTLPSRKKKRRHPESSSSSDDSGPLATRKSQAKSSICRNFTSPTAGIPLADAVEPGEINGILQLSRIAKQLLFALEPVMFFERRNEDWIMPLTMDPAYLHCQIFFAQSFSEALRQGRTDMTVPVSRRAFSHYVKGLGILAKRLSNYESNECLSKSTLATMTGFSSYALVTGDYATATRHVDGMCNIVRARGGAGTFYGGSEKLLVEILRHDLSLSLSQGSNPIFSAIAPAGEPLLQYPDLSLFLRPHNLHQSKKLPDALETIDPNLIEAWSTMADFSSLINFATYTAHRITTHTFLHTMAAVMYRLLAMDFRNNPRDEMIRLALLAFTSSVFLPWQKFGVIYVHLLSEFKKNLTLLMDPDVTRKLDVWLMMMGAISLLNEKDDWWLKPLFVFNADLCGIESWEDMRQLMEEFLWIDLVHNQRGQMVFQRLMAGVDRDQG